MYILQGNDVLVSPDEAAGKWANFGLALKDNATLHFFLSKGKDTFTVEGRRKIPVDEWTFISVCQNGNDIGIWLDGELDTEGKLGKPGVAPAKAQEIKTVTEVVESPHPYEANTDGYWTVSIPGASHITITFDPETETEGEFAYVTIFKDSTHTETWSCDNFYGLASADNGNWPGLQQPALRIPTDSFVVHLHAGESSKFGFKLIAEGCCPVLEEPAAEEDFFSGANPFPLYVGQPPLRVSDRRTIGQGWIAQLSIVPEVLGHDEIKEKMMATSPSPLAPGNTAEPKTIETLAMVRLFPLCSITKFRTHLLILRSLTYVIIFRIH